MTCLYGCEKDEPELCGNGRQDMGETCDGSSVAGQTCVSHGFVAGELSCNATCDGFDTSGCIMSVCGNGEREPTEVCDGQDFGGNSCATLAMGFVGGELGCTASCDAFVTTGCILPDLGSVTGQVSIDAAVTCDASSTVDVDCAGDVHVALYEDDPQVHLNQVPVASSFLLDTELSGDASEVTYVVGQVPVGSWYLVVFLDDNDNADLTAQTPDSGDPWVKIHPVTVTVDATTTQDAVLDERYQ